MNPLADAAPLDADDAALVSRARAGSRDALEQLISRYPTTRTRTTRMLQMSRWNFSEVYRRSKERWEIVHSHASFVHGQPPAAR